MSNRVNPENQYHPIRQHQKQTFWQIWFPLGLAIMGFFTFAILAGFATMKQPVTGEMWASISLIFMIIPVMFAGLLLLAIIIGLIYVMIKLFGIAPVYLKKAQYYTYLAATHIHNWADQGAKPIFWVKEKLSQMEKFFNRIRSFSLKRDTSSNRIGKVAYGKED